jgi:hypothetical protein
MARARFTPSVPTAAGARPAGDRPSAGRAPDRKHGLRIYLVLNTDPLDEPNARIYGILGAFFMRRNAVRLQQRLSARSPGETFVVWAKHLNDVYYDRNPIDG